MIPRYSNVFEEYAKIALDKGIISNAAEEDSKQEAQKEEPKEDKKELSSAEIFYGVKTKPIKELLEEAHPKTIVMGPSYDKFNGVVENLHQRSNIMQHIALKNPKILQTNTRYVKAQQDLVNETIKLAFYLDNINNESLMSLADSCTQNLLKREASWFDQPDPRAYRSLMTNMAGMSLGRAIAARVLPGAVGIGASLLGLLAVVGVGGLLIAHNVSGSQGVKNDLKILSESLDEVATEFPHTKIQFNEYKSLIDPTIQMLEEIDEKLAEQDEKLAEFNLSDSPEARNAAELKYKEYLKSSGIINYINTNIPAIKRNLIKINSLTPSQIRKVEKIRKVHMQPMGDVELRLYQAKNLLWEGLLEKTIDRLEVVKKSSAASLAEIDEQINNIKETMAAAKEASRENAEAESKPSESDTSEDAAIKEEFPEGKKSKPSKKVEDITDEELLPIGKENKFKTKPKPNRLNIPSKEEFRSRFRR